jgi:hypothetical protein
MMREGAVFREGQAVDVNIAWTEETHFYSRQYINWPTDPDSPWLGRKIDIEVAVTGPCMTGMDVEFSYADPPLDLQGRAFPWLDPVPGDPGPQWGDNQSNDCGFGSLGNLQAKIRVTVGQDRKASTAFYTSTFGGDNYVFFAELMCGDNSPIIVSDSTVNVWRYYFVDVWAMHDPEEIQSFYPEHDRVPEIFNECYVQFHFNYCGESEDHGFDWDAEYIEIYPFRDIRWGSLLDYLDFINLNPEIQTSIIFHNPIDKYFTPEHHIHLQGVNNLTYRGVIDAVYGTVTNYNEGIFLTDHIHAIIAVGGIRRLFGFPPSIYYTNQIVCHEFGHLLVGLPNLTNSCSIMDQGFSENPDCFSFLGIDIYTLRNGFYFDELGGIPND